MGMSGTNDIASAGEADVPKNAQDVESLHSLCWENGVPHTILLSVPHSAYDIMQRQKRAALNKLLRELCLKEPRVSFVDLDAHENRDRLELDDDGLHFTPAGYDALGDIVGAYIKSHK